MLNNGASTVDHSIAAEETAGEELETQPEESSEGGRVEAASPPPPEDPVTDHPPATSHSSTDSAAPDHHAGAVDNPSFVAPLFEIGRSPLDAPSFAPAMETPFATPALSPMSPVSLPAASSVQRAPDEGGDSGGLLSGIRSKLQSVVSGVKSGWSGLSQTAESTFNGLKERAGGIGDTLGGLAKGAMDGISSGWNSLKETAGSVTKGIETRLAAGASAITAAATRIATAVTKVDAGALRAAWNGLTGTMGGLKDAVEGLGKAAMATLSGLWTGLKEKFTGALSGLSNSAKSLMSGLTSAAQAVRGQVASLWSGIQGKASQLSGLLGGVPSFIRSLAEKLFQAGQQAWNSVQGMWNGLQQRFSGLWQQVQAKASSLWDTVKGKATSLWQSIGNGWSSLREKAAGVVTKFTGGVGTIWKKISGFAIDGLVARFEAWSVGFTQVRQAVANPEAFLEPIVTALAGKLRAELPGKSQDAVKEKLDAQGGGKAAQPAGTGGTIQRTVNRGAATNVIMRTPDRNTETFGQVWGGLVAALKVKYEQLDVLHVLWEAVKTALFPFPAIGKELVEMVGELGDAVGGLFAPRGFSDPLGMLHDLWSNLMHLVDVPLVITRHVVNIVALLAPLATIALMVLGAFGISLGAGIIGGAASGGTAAAPAAGGGAIAGAGAGLGTALALGRYLFLAFLASQGAALVKALVDLLTVRQTEDEKNKDYALATDSGIALGIAGVLYLIAQLAAYVGRIALPLLKRIPIPPRVVDIAKRFGQGVKAGEAGTKLRIAGLTDAETAAFGKEFGIDGTKALVDRYGGAAMKQYGPDFFKKWKGVTPETMAHISQGEGIKKGEIKGTHDRAEFETTIKGKGEIISETKHPTNPDVSKVEYKLYQKNNDGSLKIDPATKKPILSTGKPKLKTTIRGLKGDQAKWQEFGNQAADDAIKNGTMPKDGGNYTGNSKGGRIAGIARDGKVDTFFPDL